MTNKELLEEAIRKSGLKKGYIAQQVGLTPAGLLNCLNNKAEFKVSQVHKLCELLNLDQDQRTAIFFAVGGA